MSDQIIKGGINHQMQGFYKTFVVKGDTDEVVWEQPEWKKNLILNNGMNQVYTNCIVDLMLYAASGVGTRPNSLDGGASTISQSGATVYMVGRTGLADFTSSNGTYAASVEAGDVIQYSNLSESFVTTVTDGFNLQVTPNYTFSTPLTFTIWKTSQTGLESEVSRSTSYLVGASYARTTQAGNVATHRRTYDFSVVGSSQTYNELGICWTGTIGDATVFSRFLLSPSITIDPGFKLRVMYDLQTTWLPITESYKTASIGNWPVAPSTNTLGTESLQSPSANKPLLISEVNSFDGSSQLSQSILDPAWTTYDSTHYASVWVSPNTTNLASFGSPSVDRSSNSYSTTVMSKAAYVNNSFYLDKTGTFTAASFNRSDLASVGLGVGSSTTTLAATTARQGMAFRFNQTQSKANTQTLSFTYRWAWTRTLA